MSCLACGAALTRRHQKVYCGNRCQRARERRRNIASWQRTGIAQTGSGIGHDVRTYLLEDQGGRCALCGCTTTWQGKELRLVLDHVDGDSTDNRRDNVRLVCPNCASQLPTFTARNRGSGRAWCRQRYADGKSS